MIEETWYDLYITITVGIDDIKNLEILHNFGYIYWDLKPNNFSDGKVKIMIKLNIEIFVFSKSIYSTKQEKAQKKLFRYSIYSSNNILDNSPCQKIDALISIFYLLIKIHKSRASRRFNSNEEWWRRKY